MAPTFRSNKQRVVNLLDQLAKLAEKRIPELAGELRREIEHLRSGELNVVVCGECKRGKSSLINAFLEEPDLCPTDAPVATNAITTIRYAETERIVVTTCDDAGRTSAKDITRDELTRYVTEQGNLRNRERVQLVQIWLNNPRLKDGLVLFDTPGVGGVQLEHTAVTQSIIPCADAALFVCAADEPLSEPEARFAERIARYTAHMLMVVTKRDAVNNPSVILRTNLDKLKSKLGRDDLRGVAVSSHLKQDHLRSGDDEELKRSGFPELERALWDLLTRRSDILLGRAQAYGLQAVSQLRPTTEAEHKLLSSASSEELTELNGQLQAKIKRAEDLASDSALWINELNRRANLVQNDCNKWLSDEFAEVNRALEGYLASDRYLSNPPALADQLAADCNNSLALIVRRLEDHFGVVVSELRALTGLKEINNGQTTVKRTIAFDLSQVVPRSADSLIQTGSDIGRKVTIHSSGLALTGGLAAGLLGAIIGTFIAPGVGTAAGFQYGMLYGGAASGVAGGIFGLKRGITDRAERLQANQRHAVGGLCREQLAIARTTISHELNELMTNTRSFIHDSVLREIRRDQKACKEAAAILAKQHQEKQADHATRLRELTNALKQLDTLEAMMPTMAGDSAGVH